MAGPRSAYGSPHLPDHPFDPGRLVHGVADQVLRELRFQLNTIFTLAPFLFSGVIAFIGLGSYTSVVVRLLFFSLHLAVAGIVVGAMFPISLRLFRGNKVSSMFFIDLVGCALAPVGFWIAMSMQGIPLVAAAGTGSITPLKHNRPYPPITALFPCWCQHPNWIRTFTFPLRK